MQDLTDVCFLDALIQALAGNGHLSVGIITILEFMLISVLSCLPLHKLSNGKKTPLPDIKYNYISEKTINLMYDFFYLRYQFQAAFAVRHRSSI